MILAVSNDKQDLIKYSALSAGLTAGIQGFSYARAYSKQSAIPKDIFAKHALKNVAKNSCKSALYTAIFCGGLGIINKLIKNKSSNNIKTEA